MMGTEAVCRIAVPVCPDERSDEVLPQPAIIPVRPVRSMFVVGKQIGKMWFLKCTHKKQWIGRFDSSIGVEWKTYVKVVGIVSCSKAKSYRSENESRTRNFKIFVFFLALHTIHLLLPTWLCYTKFKMGMNDFPIYRMFFRRPWFEHFARVLCIQFAQINDNIFHARLFNAMCGSNNELSWYQNAAALIFSDTNVRLPGQCSKRCCTPTNDPLLNGILSRTWYSTLKLILQFDAQFQYKQELKAMNKKWWTFSLPFHCRPCAGEACSFWILTTTMKTTA